jgi:iron complex transport system substrate-binding protein
MVSRPARVVSLLPSLTEIACALGAVDQLVGRSHECDHPAGVETLPCVTAPRFERVAAGPSREVDAEVRRLLRDALSPFTVDAERLRALAPEVILTQDQCRACAVSLPDVERATRAAVGPGVRVLSVAPSTLGEVWESVTAVAAALGREAEGSALLAALAARVVAIGERAAARGVRPRVAVIEWLEPLMAAGHWLPELIALAGGEPLLARAGTRSRWLAWDELRAADPDVIVVSPCGFPLARTREELPLLTSLPGWSALSAARGERVFMADGNQFFNRPGPRLVESLEILAELLHPAAFDFGHLAKRDGANAGSAQPFPRMPSATSRPVSGASSTPLR